MTGELARGQVRTEHDTLGAMEVPAEALYGAQTARAVANFPLSGWPLPAGFLAALARIKAAFARANGERGLLPPEIARAVAAAAEEVADGAHLEQFPIDVFQTGSGTSTNMNMNEVVAHLANVALGGDPAAHRPVHPNDHVNLGQSSNDAVPAALRIAAAAAWRDRVRPAAAGVAVRAAAPGRRAPRHRDAGPDPLHGRGADDLRARVRRVGRPVAGGVRPGRRKRAPPAAAPPGRHRGGNWHQRRLRGRGPRGRAALASDGARPDARAEPGGGDRRPGRADRLRRRPRRDRPRPLPGRQRHPPARLGAVRRPRGAGRCRWSSRAPRSCRGR